VSNTGEAAHLQKTRMTLLTAYYYPRAWVRRSRSSVCMSVCLSVCPQHNSKTNDLKVFKLGVGNELGIPRSDMVWG